MTKISQMPTYNVRWTQGHTILCATCFVHGKFFDYFLKHKENPPRFPKAKIGKYLLIFPLALIIVSQIALGHVYKRGS